MQPEIKSLTSIRALACLSVVLGHIYNYSGGVLVGNSEFTGVLLFFCLSGFLITYLYADYRTFIEWKNYAIRRFMRIYPLYAVCVVALTGYLAFYKGNTGFVFRDKSYDGLSTLFFLSDPWLLWSVRVEMFFYLCFPFLIMATLPIRKYFSDKGMLIFLVLLLLSLHQIPYKEFDNTTERLLRTVFRSEECFLAGMIAAFAYRILRNAAQKYQTYIALLTWVLLLVYFASFSNYFWESFGLAADEYKAKHIYHYNLPISAMMGLFVLAAALADKSVGFIFHNPILLFIGNISFGIYLFHDLYLRRFMKAEWPEVNADLRLGVALLLTLLTAYILHVLIERPCIRFSKKITEKS